MIKTKLALSAAILGGLTIATASIHAVAAEKQINKTDHYSWIVYGKNQVKETVSDKALKGGKALRIVVAEESNSPGDATLQSVISGDVKQGEVMVGTVWLRTVKSSTGATGKAFLKLKQAGKPYGNVAEQLIEVGPEWKQYSIEHVAPVDYPAGSLNLTIQLSFTPQTIDVGQGAVVNRGPKTN